MRALALAVLVAVLACFVGEAAAGAVPAKKPATVQIAIEGMKYAIADAAVKPGDTIVWTNKDIVAHTVTSTSGAFDSNLIAPGGTWKYVVKKKGSFAYKCNYHPQMTASFTVR
jgi:plastocyanin